MGFFFLRFTSDMTCRAEIDDKIVNENLSELPFRDKINIVLGILSVFEGQVKNTAMSAEKSRR